MPYIILADKNQEIDRRELTEAVTVGRSLECGIQIRDPLLSRQHCRLEPIGSTWVLTDLNSRNGTFINHGERVMQHVLEEGDVLRIGRVRLCFRAGPFVAGPPRTTYSKMMRPSDPVEALSGCLQLATELAPRVDGANDVPVLNSVRHGVHSVARLAPTHG